MKKIIWIIIAVLVLVGGYTLLHKKQGVVVKNDQPIKIGAIISQSGFAAPFGEMSKYGMDLAMNEINAQGGIDGRKVEIKYENDQTDPKVAVGLYQKFTTIDHVDGIIGSNFDFVTQPVFELAKTSDTVIISPTNPRIAGVFDTNANSFVMLTDFSKIISGLTSYLSGHPYKQLATVHFKSGFGAEIAKTLKGINANLKKPEMIDESYGQIGNNDFKTLILKLKQAGVDTVFLDMIGSDPITFLSQAKALKFTPQVITYTAIQDSMAIEGTDKSLFEGIIVLDWEVSPASFAKKFEETYHKKPAHGVAVWYDAVYVMAKAIAESKIHGEISSVLETTKFTTPNGDFKFTADHAALDTPIVIEVVKNGELVEVKN